MIKSNAILKDDMSAGSQGANAMKKFLLATLATL